MNCTELFFKQAKERPETIALFDFKGNKTTFKDLSRMSFLAQNELRKEGMKPGDTILLQEFPGPRLYSLVIGILSLGATAILVEPWMPIQNIEKVINEVKPKLFFSGFIGKLWGLRVKGVRNIDRWIGPSLFKKPIPSKDHFILEDVEDNIPGIITFTTGTTGDPKGVVRNQGYLVHQHRILSKVLEIDKHKGTDLCVFANFVFLNLASGRPSLIMPMKWTEKNFKKLKSFNIDGFYLQGCLSHEEVRVVSIKNDKIRPTFKCEILGEYNHKKFLGFNRAKASILEACILASRLKILDEKKIRNELEYLNISVKKTASYKELRSWKKLNNFIEDYFENKERK